MAIAKGTALRTLDIEGLPAEPTNPLKFAGSSERRRATKARSLREMWVDSRCDYLMTFIEFRQQSARKRILKSLGKDPLYLPGEAMPGGQRKRQKRR